MMAVGDGGGDRDGDGDDDGISDGEGDGDGDDDYGDEENLYRAYSRLTMIVPNTNSRLTINFIMRECGDRHSSQMSLFMALELLALKHSDVNYSQHQ